MFLKNGSRDVSLADFVVMMNIIMMSRGFGSIDVAEGSTVPVYSSLGVVCCIAHKWQAHSRSYHILQLGAPLHTGRLLTASCALCVQIFKNVFQFGRGEKSPHPPFFIM